MGDQQPSTQPNIVLVGFMGSGKSEVGRRLADETGRKLVEVDLLATADGVTIAEIFASEGEAGFRRRERAAVERAGRARNAVISTGGGTVLDPKNVKTLKRAGVLVYLKVDADELVRRLARSSRERPLLRGEAGDPAGTELQRRVENLLAQRVPVYESVADHVVVSDDRDPQRVVEEIVRRLGSNGGARADRVRVALDPPYTVHVGRGLLGRARELVKLPRATEKACVVSHPRIRRLWGDAVERGLKQSGLEVYWATFPAGEERKTLDTAANLTRSLARAGLHREDVVIALGGGVVGDVAGYVASTFARGVPLVQIPTTLLAMVDSSIGGKTGVNLAQGKNLVGTFHQPLGVIADLDVLVSLPDRELRGGLAEVIKYGFIADPPLADLVLRKREEILARGAALHGLVVRCAKIKASVVASDERDRGERAILNYGHTLGHALEAISVSHGAAKLHHGEAIAIGMVYAAAVSTLLGVASVDLVESHRQILESVGLPTAVEGVKWNEVRERMTMDKKYARGDRLVLLEEPGRTVVRPVPAKILQRAFAEVSS